MSQRNRITQSRRERKRKGGREEENRDDGSDARANSEFGAVGRLGSTLRWCGEERRGPTPRYGSHVAQGNGNDPE